MDLGIIFARKDYRRLHTPVSETWLTNDSRASACWGEEEDRGEMLSPYTPPQNLFLRVRLEPVYMDEDVILQAGTAVTASLAEASGADRICAGVNVIFEKAADDEEDTPGLDVTPGEKMAMYTAMLTPRRSYREDADEAVILYPAGCRYRPGTDPEEITQALMQVGALGGMTTVHVTGMGVWQRQGIIPGRLGDLYGNPVRFADMQGRNPRSLGSLIEDGWLCCGIEDGGFRFNYRSTGYKPRLWIRF